MTRALVVALGNPLRRDDGVAHHVLKLLAWFLDVESQTLLQLTPEIAEEIACYKVVMFIDADTTAADLCIEPVDESPSLPVLTHVSTPAAIVALSRTLYGFAGRAFLCRIPVDDLSPGEGLSRRASVLAVRAAEELETLLGGLRLATGDCL
jgi:Ni,Fe-hydrogenase maturation factor